EMERVISGIKSTLKSLSFIIRDKVFIEGGPSLYLKLSKFMESTARNVSEKEVAGCLVLKDVMIKMAKILIKNFDGSVEENIVKVEKGQWERVIDNYIVVNRVIANACVMSVSLLMVDEIIKAGKQLREDNMNGKEGH
ncbi:subunit zeta of T-complex protein 1, partial [Hamiltosporidium tvaerminnensis]